MNIKTGLFLAALSLIPAQFVYGTTSVPSKPLDVVVKVVKGVTTISWAPPTSSGGSPVKKYTAWSQDGAGCSARGPRARKCSIKKLSERVRIFSVIASNKVGDSEASDPSNPTIASTKNIDAQCGTAHDIYQGSMPTGSLNLCLAGLPTVPVGNSSGSFSWSCVGYGTGQTQYCATLPSINVGIPRDLTKAEKEYFSTVLLKTIPTYLKSPSSFKVIEGPTWYWYREIGLANEGAWVIHFDANNLFGVPLRTMGICTMKYMKEGYWSFDLTSDLRLCNFF